MSINYHHHYNHHQHEIRQTILRTTLTITTIVTTYYLTKSIRNYGIAGTLRYIWEGDHLSPEIRDAVDTLEEVELKLKKQKKKLDKVEIMIEVERLNSVDGVSDGSDSINQLEPSVTLSKDLTMLSYTLDKIAAEIDSVQSYGDVDVKRRKKENSSTLVSMMEKVDRFLKECGIET